MNIRKIALTLLDEYEAGEKYVNLSLSSHLTDALKREERASLTALLYTTVERKLTYDYYIAALAGRNIDDVALHTKNILRLGMCQILDMSSIPDFAAVNETVKLSDKKSERSFVNAILRRLIRERENLPMPNSEKSFNRYLSVKHSFPLHTVKLFDSLFGRDQTESLLSFFNAEKYTDVFVNTLKISVEDYIKKLLESGFSAEPKEGAPNTVRINSSVNPEALFGFSKGLFFVQDVACAMALEVLSPNRGDRVIDVCACPGGKSFAADIMMENEGEIFSFDLHESKLSLVTDGARRLGLDKIKAVALDATKPQVALFGTADKVICDVPCSGLGVLGKKPDLRYKSAEIFDTLPPLQEKILTASAKYLKLGGELLYSTCTLNPKENCDVVKAFLRENDSFSPVDFFVGELRSEDGMMTLIPHVNKCDGFFIAKIKRIK